MSVFQRVTDWLSGRSSHNAQSAYGSYKQRGYYGSSQAEDAYGGMNAERSADMPEKNYGSEMKAPADRFNTGGGEPYGGRVPYRSQLDIYAEQEARERQAQEEYQQSMQPDMRHRRTDAQQMPYQPQTTANIVDFPGQQASTPTHVEYVILLRSRNECTKVIEYIKTNASVFLNMEYIANEGERQRCVDMLSGAAYTLGCQLHKISNRGIYLIASPYVRVMIDPAMKRFTSTAEAQPFMPQQTGEYPPVQSQAEWQPLTPAPNFASRQMSESAGYSTAPYQPQLTPQQAMYNSFQRPRPSFQSQTQAEPYRRASGGQYGNRQPASYQANF